MIKESSLSASLTSLKAWFAIGKHAHKVVFRLQRRIAKALEQKRFGKVKSLCYLLTHSFFAKVCAILKVKSNKGGKTSGVDKQIWTTANQLHEAIKQLNQRGYHPKPLRRIYIKKKNGKLRPLSIPTMLDRAMQALYYLAYEPIGYWNADVYSFGFRPKHACADAIEQCFKNLSQKSCSTIIYDADITGCFDNIDHQWIINNLKFLDRKIIQKWLKCGYIFKKEFLATEKGTPQGGIISPLLANMVLDGMQEHIRKAVKLRRGVNFVRYADDFIITAPNIEIVEERIKPAVEKFLKVRGLDISQEKTRTVNIYEGFDFLSFNIRKYSNGKLLIKPAKKALLSLLEKVRLVLKKNRASTIWETINQLNPILRGWANYFRHVVSKHVFNTADHIIRQMLIKWAERRHPTKRRGWIWRKYFTAARVRGILSTKIFNHKKHCFEIYCLYSLSYVPIIRHVKIRSKANPFLAEYDKYFAERTKKRIQQRELVRQQTHYFEQNVNKSTKSGTCQQIQAFEMPEPDIAKVVCPVL
jgi:RNA-directed DNA polymerase